jgi:hypothetical protein
VLADAGFIMLWTVAAIGAVSGLGTVASYIIARVRLRRFKKAAWGR